MKKYFLLYGILAVSLLAGFLFYANTLRGIPSRTIDYVAINEITKQAALNWQNLRQLNSFEFSYRFVVLDNEGNVRYASYENLPDSLSLAVRQGFFPMDIALETGAAGKALIETSRADTLKQVQSKLAALGLAAFALMCILNFLFLLTLHKVLVVPFKRLESFAHKISTGRFDEPLPMDRNNIFGLFTQSFDLMRSSLYEARQNQMKAEREKKELIAQLNHDIKNPVTSIRVIAELLQVGSGEEAVKEKLGIIEMKADQIGRLMDDMLHSALEELGELKVNPSSMESDVLKDLFLGADDLSKIRVGAIPPCLIEVDTRRMEQVIGNVITNSYKYAGTEIDIDFKISGELLYVDINDYGKGVESESIELITTKFYRGENAKASQKEGEGLGLYIAKLLMEKMGGELEAFNRKDGFTIRLLLRLSH